MLSILPRFVAASLAAAFLLVQSAPAALVWHSLLDGNASATVGASGLPSGSAGYNNSWIHSNAAQRVAGSMIRDQWMRQSMIDMGNPAGGEGFMVHMFVNGLYWGVHNLCERADASHYAAHNGGDVDFLDARNGAQYTDGNGNAWNQIAGVVNSGDWTKIPQVTEDEVIYQSTAPWPEDAGGSGEFLNRAGIGLFGNFASSWSAESPTPGGARLSYDDFNAIFGIGAKPVDFELDGLANVVEFALGLNPTAFDANALPGVVIEGADATFSYTKNLLLSGITTRVEYSTNLANWFFADETILSTNNFSEVRKARVAISPNTCLFMRLRIDY